MNKEEAIERLNNFKTIRILYGNTFGMHLEQLKQLQNDIETVLNLLKKKDEIIDEIIGFVATRTWATCPNEDCGADLDCENRCSNDEGLFEECWKMYFEKKAGK